MSEVTVKDGTDSRTYKGDHVVVGISTNQYGGISSRVVGVGRDKISLLGDFFVAVEILHQIVETGDAGMEFVETAREMLVAYESAAGSGNDQTKGKKKKKSAS